MDPCYSISQSYTEAPTNAHFGLHNHNSYEILLFLEGDAKYVVEDNVYTMEPGDLIIIRKHELHRIYHNSPTPYGRVVLMVSPDFFRENACAEYEAQFLHAPLGTGHKIAAETVRSSGLYDAFLRYKRYSEDYRLPPDTPVLKSVILEILYLINRTSRFSSADVSTGPIKSVILYLNNNYTGEITLDILQEKFFISKYYLCREFRKATGLTVHEYIRRKRLTKVRELRAQGLHISDAALEAGFCDYSSFYRAFRKEYGVPPRREL
ncbi:MAG: AraC family transcriptional regulator [Roseburia sp.]|nr:AraC family transcriptional regulator [Roseburia sp.]MCM1098000.1 AraC family transcriptional regulator [Ruminococcus flavefaciens]